MARARSVSSGPTTAISLATFAFRRLSPVAPRKPNNSSDRRSGLTQTGADAKRRSRVVARAGAEKGAPAATNAPNALGGRQHPRDEWFVPDRQPQQVRAVVTGAR